MSVRSATVCDRPGAADNGERGALQLLVVDDDATQRTLIAQAAKLAGHGVSFAATCAEAIAEIQKCTFPRVSLYIFPVNFGSQK